MSQQIRTFVAIELPDALKISLKELQDSLKGQLPASAVRWTRGEGIHLTLKFLGDTPVNQIAEIAGALESAAAHSGPFPCSVGGLGCFPNLRRPRVIWVGAEDPTDMLARLQEAVETACAGLGFARERRAFHPHLTLGRLQDRASSADIQAVSNVVQRTEAVSLGTVTVRGISLIRSDLRPTGAVYTTLRWIEIPEG